MKPVTFSEKETKTDKPLRFLQVHMFYDHYLGDFYRRYPQLVHAPFQEQIDALVKDGFSAIHILAPYMNEVGYDAQLIVGNNPVSQLQWLKEAGISEPTSGHWVKEIVREQIDKIKPDVLYLSEPILLDSSFIRTLSHRPKVILGWRAANIPSGTDWSEFDVILSCLSGIREAAKLLGAKDTAHFWPGFPSWIYDEIAEIQPSRALSFSGQWTESQHPARNRYLDTIARHAQNKGYDISLHLSGEIEKVTPSVKNFLAHPVYGIEMHRTLRQGKVAFDARGNIGLLDLPAEAQAKLGDLARNETANMRIIEATGSGVFLLTEEKENLSELYEPGKEIVTFSSESDLLEKIDYYLAHDYEREAIMQAALTRCRKEHSMDQCSRKLDAIIKNKLGREEASRNEKSESNSATTPQKPTKKFLISGIAPYEYGTGKLYASLIPHAQAQGYTVIHPMPGKILHDDAALNFDSISDSTVFLLHPQSIGLEKVLGLLRRNNDVRMYVLDSSFFCIQSYNHREEIRGECLNCLGSTSQCHSDCVPYPVKYDKQLNLSFLEELREHAAHITFYCQTESQKQLILKHFESVRDTQVVGMLTQEYEISPDTVAPPQQHFDIVFHADPLPAKGVEYALLLSFYLGDLSVLFPFDRNYLTTMVPHAKVPANATIQPMRWESGLMNAVTHAKAVLCPSLWSAPVEGALMKSLYFNGNVAVFDTEYGFHKEIPLDHVTKLGKDIFKASKIFRDSLSLDKEKRLASRQWVENYNNAINFEKLFV